MTVALRKEVRAAYRRYKRAVRILCREDPYEGWAESPLIVGYEEGDPQPYLATIGLDRFDLGCAGRSEAEALNKLLKQIRRRLSGAAC